ncbi:MAG: ion transporter [Odoribacter splanchnicus]
MTNKVIKIPFFQLIIFLLSIYIVIVMILQFFLDFSPEMEKLLWIIDTGICCIFIIDFIISLITAENKKNYLLKCGLIDLIASIPNVGILRIGRLAKVIRVIRMIKAVKSINDIFTQTFKNKGEGIFKSVVILSILLVIISSMLILIFEKGIGVINTANDAFWWTVYTLLGMDYCQPPISIGGKIIAILLALAGMTLLGSFTAYLAEIFFNNKKQ